MADRSNPHGDDQGTRVGSPDTGSPSQRNQSRGSTGAGAEAAEGIHSADGGRDPSERSALESQPTGRGGSETSGGSGDVSPSGSEPLVDRENEHRSGYGGAAGKPVRSADHREPENVAKTSLHESGASNQDVRDTKRSAREQMEEDI